MQEDGIRAFGKSEERLKKEARNITPQNGSFTSGFDRGRCVVTAVAQNPALVCAWLDQMYDPFQSPQNNWGTYGENDEFDIFELGENANGEEMLKHAPLGDASPVEVREAEAVGGPLAVLDEYYDVYVTCPDDAQYRLDWIMNGFTDADWDKYLEELDAYGLQKYLDLFQKYLDNFYADQTEAE